MANTRTTAPDALNVLTDREAGQSVLNTLQGLQLDKLNLKMARYRDGNDGSRPSGHYDAAGEPISYDDRYKELEKSEEGLLAEYQGLLETVKAMAEERRQQEAEEVG